MQAEAGDGWLYMNNPNDSYTLFEGRQLYGNVTFRVSNPMLALPGDREMLLLDESLLSKHILLAGGIGTGKTNVLNYFISNMRDRMSDNDVMVIFDSKGDFYNTFYRPGDIVVSNDEKTNVFWNLFSEVEIDGRVEENILEISSFLFKDKTEHTSNPFFPNAAKQIFSSLLTFLVRKGHRELLNNASLRDILDSTNDKDYRNWFSQYDDLKGVCSYIGEDAPGQTQGVISELQQTVREFLIGNYKKEGYFSIRRAIRERKKKVIFIEYDLSLGRTVSPVISLIIDLAIKEALCKEDNKNSNAFFFLDEFRLLRPLEHMDNGINFGRSKGAKFVLGIQNVEQVYDIYGEYAGRSILSGCSTLFSFNVSDRATREIIKERGGSNLKKLTFMSKIQSRGINEQILTGSVIEDWDISNLGVGEAIIQTPISEPFKFKFRKFQ